MSLRDVQSSTICRQEIHRPHLAVTHTVKIPGKTQALQQGRLWEARRLTQDHGNMSLLNISYGESATTRASRSTTYRPVWLTADPPSLLIQGRYPIYVGTDGLEKSQLSQHKTVKHPHMKEGRDLSRSAESEMDHKSAILTVRCRLH